MSRAHAHFSKRLPVFTQKYDCVTAEYKNHLTDDVNVEDYMIENKDSASTQVTTFRLSGRNSR
jgi:hypothetical protein